MLPGFIPRLHAELLRAISPPPSSATNSRPPSRPGKRPRPTGYDRYAALRTLGPSIAILNNPAPPPPASTRQAENAGKAPAFTPATFAWIGGSLAGYVTLLSCRDSSESSFFPVFSRLVVRRWRVRDGTRRTLRQMTRGKKLCLLQKHARYKVYSQTGHGRLFQLAPLPQDSLNQV